MRFKFDRRAHCWLGRHHHDAHLPCASGRMDVDDQVSQGCDHTGIRPAQCVVMVGHHLSVLCRGLV